MAPVAYSTAVAQSGGDLTPSALTKRGHGHHSHGHQGHRHSALGDAVVPAHSHAHGGLTATLPDARFKPRALTGAALDDIARRVRSQSDRFQAALQPVAESVKAFAENSPVIFTFLAIFTALSLIPVMIFIGFFTAIAVFSVGAALIVLCCTLIGTIMFGLTILIPVLIMTGTLALLAVGSLLGLFLAHRLYLHLTEASSTAAPGTTSFEVVGAGTRAWWDETRSRVGLGPYSYPVAAFEDYKAVGIGSPIKAEPATSAHAPRLVYDEIDYSKNHPQPTPSFRTAKDEPDIFAPSSPEYRAPDSLAVSVKRQPSDQGQWDSGSGADVKDKGEKA